MFKLRIQYVPQGEIYELSARDLSSVMCIVRVLMIFLHPLYVCLNLFVTLFSHQVHIMLPLYFICSLNI